MTGAKATILSSGGRVGFVITSAYNLSQKGQRACVACGVSHYQQHVHWLQIPLAMDAIGSFVVAASAPLDIRVWRVDTQPASKLNGDATTTLTLVRELSIMSVGQPLRV